MSFAVTATFADQFQRYDIDIFSPKHAIILIESALNAKRDCPGAAKGSDCMF